jgi:hypothetical protein
MNFISVILGTETNMRSIKNNVLSAVCFIIYMNSAERQRHHGF